MSDPTHFQYCPKFILFSADKKSVFMAKRFGEQDYDGIFSFIGGKTETTDESLLAGLKREKDEEIGPDARIRVCWTMSCYQVLYRKKDGNSMVLPNHVAIFEGGEIALNPAEYSEYKWVPLDEFADFEPKIAKNTDAIQAAQRMLKILTDADFSTI
jgi:8-oxo-dGTP pyrophosphatase MutT (NUDIX family)